MNGRVEMCQPLSAAFAHRILSLTDIQWGYVGWGNRAMAPIGPTIEALARLRATARYLEGRKCQRFQNPIEILCIIQLLSLALIISVVPQKQIKRKLIDYNYNYKLSSTTFNVI